MYRGLLVSLALLGLDGVRSYTIGIGGGTEANRGVSESLAKPGFHDSDETFSREDGLASMGAPWDHRAELPISFEAVDHELPVMVQSQGQHVHRIEAVVHDTPAQSVPFVMHEVHVHHLRGANSEHVLLSHISAHPSFDGEVQVLQITQPSPQVVRAQPQNMFGLFSGVSVSRTAQPIVRHCGGAVQPGGIRGATKSVTDKARGNFKAVLEIVFEVWHELPGKFIVAYLGAVSFFLVGVTLWFGFILVSALVHIIATLVLRGIDYCSKSCSGAWYDGTKFGVVELMKEKATGGENENDTMKPLMPN